MREPLPEWPMFGLSDDARPALRRARDAGEAVALATLVGLDGGGPRPPGTQMVFSPLEVSGYFSGGCVESDIADHAFACLADGSPRTLVYGRGSPWPDISLLCGARLEIFVERVPAEDPALAELLAAEDERRPVTWVSDGVTRACAEDLSPWPEAAVSRAFAPRQRLIVVGGDPTAIAIASLGVQAGFETTLVRAKGPATPPPVAGLGYRRDSVAEVLADIGPDAWTAVAIASHDLDLDRDALMAATPSAAGYVGLLGARRRLPDRVAPLVAAGVAAHLIERIHAPIGLDIGGKAPWEVAVSVIGEIMAERYADPSQPQKRSSGSTQAASPGTAAGAPA